MDPSDDRIRLVRCTARGLLGSHRFTLQLEVGGATLLTGANGTGKSTILRAIDRFGRGAWDGLAKLPVKHLTLEFAEGPVVTISKRDKLVISNGDESWEFKPSKFLAWSSLAKFSSEEALARAENILLQPNITLSSSAEIQPFGDIEPYVTLRDTSFVGSPPEWLRDIVERFNVLFITDQRLVIEDKQGAKDSDAQAINAAVTAYADDMRQRVESALSDYGVQAQALDRAFPNTVLQAMRQTGKAGGKQSAANALKRVQLKREALQNAGLVQSDEPPPALEKQLQPREIAFIRTYADFALRKYEVLDPLLQRVTAFTRFLNARYADKEIRIQRDQGFVVMLRDGSMLEPAALSSGEQQMLVLAYQIIFLAAPQTLVLIDEPELSLHVSWQTSLVDDLVEMGSASGLSFLLATHSPTLIGGRRSQRRSLDRRRV